MKFDIDDFRWMVLAAVFIVIISSLVYQHQKTCRGRADQSVRYGWSTHQVEANRALSKKLVLEARQIGVKE